MYDRSNVHRRSSTNGQTEEIYQLIDFILSPGAEFTRHAEAIFYPGNQRLSIVQTGRGIDNHNHLNVDTVVSGSVPFLPSGSEVTMDPFKEIYQYYPSGNRDN